MHIHILHIAFIIDTPNHLHCNADEKRKHNVLHSSRASLSRPRISDWLPYLHPQNAFTQRPSAILQEVSFHGAAFCIQPQTKSFLSVIPCHPVAGLHRTRTRKPSKSGPPVCWGNCARTSPTTAGRISSTASRRRKPPCASCLIRTRRAKCAE